jgi:hypothetical protein
MLDDTDASTDTEEVASHAMQSERDAVRAHGLQVLKPQRDLEHARRQPLLGVSTQEAETTADNNVSTRQAALDILQNFPQHAQQRLRFTGSEGTVAAKCLQWRHLLRRIGLGYPIILIKASKSKLSKLKHLN